MKILGIFLNWIVVENLDKAVQFYTEIVGLKLNSLCKDYGWAELSGPEGGRLGIAVQNPKENIKAGTNAVLTITIDDIQKGRDELKNKGVRLLGEIMEIPGEVKLQTFLDIDGNMAQLVEKLSHN